MPEQDQDIELALAALRPRAPGPEVARALARSLDDAAPRRAQVILWASGLAAAACLALAFLMLPEAQPPTPAFSESFAQPMAAAGRAMGAGNVFSAEPAAAAAAPAAVLAAADVVAAPPAQYRLVGAARSPASLEMLEPVRLRDGTYARPVRFRREHSTHWETPGSGARLVRYRPEEGTIFLPLETY